MLRAYLERIGIEAEGRAADLELLADLQAAHMMAVPFENLDVYHRRGVRTDVDWSVPKVVDRRRGGWCFELNGAFGWLLEQLGYRADYVSCRVRGSDGWGPALDHCANVVHLDGRRWLVDVGFGDSCVTPILLADGDYDVAPRPVRCRITSDGNGDYEAFVIAEQMSDGQWEDQLWGSFAARAMDDFTARSDYLQTEPGLPWTERPFATRATASDGSRVTLRPNLLRVREGRGEFVDRQVDIDDWPALLQEQFGLDDLGPRPPAH